MTKYINKLSIPQIIVFAYIFVILLMLIGRVGVMTFLWSLVGEKNDVRINYPEINLLIG